MKYWITGDTHLMMDKFVGSEIQKHDTIIILGDHMLTYYVEWDEKKNIYKLNKTGKKILKIMNRLPYNFFVIQGSREAPPVLVSDMIDCFAFDGTAYACPSLAKNVIFAKDGEVYQIGKHTCLVCGGASAPDESSRSNAHENKMNEPRYFPESESSLNNFNDFDNEKYKNVDTVLAHTCPIDMRPYDFYKNNSIQSFSIQTENKLQELMDKSLINVKDFYSGYFHIDASKEKNNIHYHFLYNCVEEFI